MRKILASLAWAAIPALLLSACNGSGSPGSGVSAIPNVSHHGHAHRGASTSDIHGGGATFPAYGYNLGAQPVGTPGAGQPTPAPGSVLAAAEATFGNTDSVYYCLTGSGFGRKEFDGTQSVGASACQPLTGSPSGFGAYGDPVNFIGSDVAFASTECCGSGTPYATHYAGTNGQPFEIPTYGGPIVYPYLNTGGASCTGLCGLGSNALQLSTWTACAITNGTIGYWHDPAITADNGGTKVAGHQAITFYYRSDGSGTTYLFEQHLNNNKAGCNQKFKAPYNAAPYASPSRSAAWAYGIPNTSDNWTGPTGTQASGSTFTGESGNPGIIEAIQGSIGTGAPYATGYAEGAWALAATSPTVLQASLQNGISASGGAIFVAPTNASAVATGLKKAKTISYGVGSDGRSLSSSTPWCQLYIDPATFIGGSSRPPAGAYPIVGLSYWVFYGSGNSSHFSDLKKMITFMATPKKLDPVIAPLEYTPLNKTVYAAELTALNGTGGNAPCLGT